MTLQETIAAPSLLIIYLVVINLITFLLYGMDKIKARRSQWRVPEAVLIGFAVIGGSLGAWFGMIIWHHKTQHKKFKYGVPAILIIQMTILTYWWMEIATHAQ
ncbi:MAG: DUF1294 domain-containing protein [Bacteroidales bacterium]|nr:DUF1294 domain-containing protein [Bacteroidales bacterium]